MHKRIDFWFSLFNLSVLILFCNISTVSGALPSEIFSPVNGPLEIVSSQEQCSGKKWCFNQHKTGGHVAGGGICQSDDTNAWDANLNTPTFDSDAGKPVYATAPGKVAETYGGCTNAGGSYGQVLIEHTSGNTVWWSGYLHLKQIRVKPNQSVDIDTVIGYVSHTSPTSVPNHLHFVVYTGNNTQHGLVSFNANILPMTNPDEQAKRDSKTERHKIDDSCLLSMELLDRI